MPADVVPELVEAIEKGFNKRYKASKTIDKLVNRMTAKRATQANIHAYALETGKCLRDTLTSVLGPSALPDGTLYYNIAERTIIPALERNHIRILDYANDVQTAIYGDQGMVLGVMRPSFAKDRAYGLIDKMGGLPAEDAARWMREPVINFCEKVVDDWVKTNADALYGAGFNPKIVRTLGPAAVRETQKGYPQIYFIPCEWCEGLAGEYDYKDVANSGNDVYRRHEGCRCEITYVTPHRADNVNEHKRIENIEDLAARLNYNTDLYRANEETIKR